jgi:hypothetical protein
MSFLELDRSHDSPLVADTNDTTLARAAVLLGDLAHEVLDAFGRASTAFAHRPRCPDSRGAAALGLQLAVRTFVVHARTDGVPVERILVSLKRLTVHGTPRYVLPIDTDELRTITFRTFLSAYYSTPLEAT